MTSPAETAYQQSPGGNDGVRQLVLDHLDLVNRVVDSSFRTVRGVVSRDDLIGAGMLGLVEAAHRFDPAEGVQFRTFANYRIKGAVVDLLRQYDWLSKSVREKLTDLRNRIHDFRAEHGRRPSIAELAEAAGLSEQNVLKYLSYEKWDRVASIEGVAAVGEESGPLSDLIPSQTATPEEAAEHRERVERLADAIQSLPEQQQQVIVMYYYEDLYMSEMAEVLGVTEGRISQIHTEAIYNLSRKMEAD